MRTTKMLAPRVLTTLVAVTASLGLGLGTVATTSSPAEAAVPHVKKASRSNLLRSHDFTDHGFARATVTPWSDDLAGTSDCDAPFPEGSHGFVSYHTNLYDGAQTAADETVVQFRHKAEATHYVKVYRAAMDGCQAMWGKAHWRTTSTQHLQLSHKASADYWVIRNHTLGFTIHQTLSVVQRGGRVGVLNLGSASSHPERTTDVPALMKDMAREMARS